MSKAKELLKELNKVFKLPELDAALSASNLDDAINDDLLTKVKETTGATWLTSEAAKNNTELADYFKEKWKPVHTKSFLEKNEKEFDELFSDLGDDVKEELSKRTKLTDKLAYAKELAKAAKQSGSSEEVEKYKKTVNDLKKQLSTVEEAKQKEFEEVKKKASEEISGYKNGLIKERFKQVATSKEWADAYKIDDVRNPVLDSVYSKLSEKAIIDLDKTGNIVLKNKENPELELFEGSKKVSFNELVEAQIAPFIKKSNGTGNIGGGEQKQKPLTTNDMNGMSWQERQVAIKRQQQTA